MFMAYILVMFILIVYKHYYTENKLLSYVGFRQNHPHDSDSIIRVAFVKETTPDKIFPLIAECCLKGIEIFKHIMSFF